LIGSKQIQMDVEAENSDQKEKGKKKPSLSTMT
jgi:hypothetical protein